MKTLKQTLDRASNSTLKQVAYRIRSQADYDKTVKTFLTRIRDHAGCVGHSVALDDLLALPELMHGYKESFTLFGFYGDTESLARQLKQEARMQYPDSAIFDK